MKISNKSPHKDSKNSCNLSREADYDSSYSPRVKPIKRTARGHKKFPIRGRSIEH